MHYQQMPLLRLITGPPCEEDAAMEEIAAFIRHRVADLPDHSAVGRELSYVAQRLELASQSPPQTGEAARLGTA